MGLLFNTVGIWLLALSIPTSLAGHAHSPCFGSNNNTQPQKSLKVAIIGSGPAGSSSAYFLKHFNNVNSTLSTSVTVYERDNRIGGRVENIYPWNDDPFRESGSELPIEAGASIFLPANLNLIKAQKLFNLSRSPIAKGVVPGTAYWDGKEVIITQDGSDESSEAYVKRYGIENIVNATTTGAVITSSYGAVYNTSFISGGPFSKASEFLDRLGLTKFVRSSAWSFFPSSKSPFPSSEKFVNEVVAASTSNNYGSDTRQIHALGAGVLLSTSIPVSIKGGNKQIFEQFINHSGAKTRLGRRGTVISLFPLELFGKRKWVVKSLDGHAEIYDAIILAAPFHQSRITVPRSTGLALIPYTKYLSIHVSFVITSSPTAQSSYFNYNGTMPQGVGCTFDLSNSPKPEFNSLRYLKALKPSTSKKFGSGVFYVVKIFSKNKLSDKKIDQIFGKGKVTKIVRKTWLAYPQLKPINSKEVLPEIRPDRSIYYANAMERVITTMETSTVAGFNSVSLLLHDHFGYTPPSSWALWP